MKQLASSRRGPRASWFAGLAALCFGCSFVAQSEIEGSGLGTLCTANDQCHAGVCDEGICVASCSVDGDCPTRTQCFASKCQKPLKVAALWIGVVTGSEGWNSTHHEGMVAAKAALPYIDWYSRENIFPDGVSAAVDDAVKKDVDVVVLNSFSHREPMFLKAEQYPKLKFLNCSGDKSNKHNAMSYDGHIEQSWWVAGRVAAGKATNRLGFVASFITPEVVRYISAFLLGARSVNPNIQLEVQWNGFWTDYRDTPSDTYKHEVLTDNKEVRVFREDLLTYRLIEAGAEVIAHSMDSQRPVRLIEQLTEQGVFTKLGHRVYSVSNDNPHGYRKLDANRLPNGPPTQSCLGSPFWNWAPLYKQLFDEIHRGKWNPERNRNEVMSVNTDQSVPGFNLNPDVGIDDSSVRASVTMISEAGWERVFAGPYETNGQRDRNVDGHYDEVQFFREDEKMDEDEYNSMCWFPKGVIEKADVTNPKSADMPARVPDEERLQDPKFRNDLLGPPGTERGSGVAAICRLNI